MISGSLKLFVREHAADKSECVHERLDSTILKVRRRVVQSHLRDHEYHRRTTHP